MNNALYTICDITTLDELGNYLFELVGEHPENLIYESSHPDDILGYINTDDKFMALSFTHLPKGFKYSRVDYKTFLLRHEYVNYLYTTPEPSVESPWSHLKRFIRDLLPSRNGKEQI